MTEQILDNREIDLDDIKKLIHRKGKKIGVSQLIVKKGFMIAKKTDIIKVKISHKNGRTTFSPGFPTPGNSVQMIASVIFIIVFFLLQIRFSLFFAIILGQLISLAVHYPKSNQFKREIKMLIQNNHQ